MILNELESNRWAKISQIHLSWEDRKRLIEMGILPGARIKLISENPFGGVFLIQVEDTHLAIGLKMAKAIDIEYCKEEGQ